MNVAIRTCLHVCRHFVWMMNLAHLPKPLANIRDSAIGGKVHRLQEGVKVEWRIYISDTG